MSTPVNKTLDEVRGDLYARIAEVQAEYAAKGWLPAYLNLNKGVVRGLIELWAWGLYQLYAYLALVLEQAFPDTAGTAWLDRHADQLELPRRPATKARGVVIFSRSGTAGNVRIPAGRIVRTVPDALGQVYRFVTTADVVLPAGQTEVAAPVEAEEYGRAANATPGLIREFSTHVPGVEAVTNRADWLTSEGADEETDEALRARYRLAWLANNGVTKYAYAAWALEVPGVVSVSILDQHPRGQGTVDVVIKGAAGLPTQALLDRVAAAIQGDETTPRAPINDDWRVLAPTPVPVSIEAAIEYVSGAPALILAQAETRLRALFEDPTRIAGVTPLQIGEDLPLDRLVATVMAVPGVKRLRIASPAADVAVPASGLAVLTGLALAPVLASEA